MTTLREAAQQALWALQYHVEMTWPIDRTSEAIFNLRAALAEPVEPVKHKHQWFSTGAMEPGEMRCIHCGAWAKEKNT